MYPGFPTGIENMVLLKSTRERVHFMVKLPAIISLQACKFTKNELLTHIVQGF